MESPEEKRWERMQQFLVSESQGNGPVGIRSTRTLFGIKSHVEEVLEQAAAEDDARCMPAAEQKEDESE